ncbi:MAG: thiamine phosphate synthase [Deltaproteobacteria bacterium]|nr:thiamine phosphate synthase [Deltaproteobacteria bacterium]PWB64516.1 MAG: thiamine phosphate synthase [Deltaproteobacteria bacterium]
MPIDFRIYLVTDRKQCSGEDIVGAVGNALEGGVRAVQLREKDLPGRELFRLASLLRRLTETYGAKLLINDRVDVALAVGADGVHLGALSLPPGEARRLLGASSVIGCSTHNAEELRDAETGGADFATFGPVYPTPSKAAYGPPVGVPALAAACRAARIPVFAIGGVGLGNAEATMRTGCFGVAMISGIVAAQDPRAAAAEIAYRISHGRNGGDAEREGAS